MHLLDPDYLPKTIGTLERFLLNPKGDIDGLLLIDGTEIHTPPHLSSQLFAALVPGAKLTVRGVKPRDGDVIVAVAIDPAERGRIIDNGPPPGHGKHHKHHEEKKPPHAPDGRSKPVTRSSVIEHLLHGPKGNVHGALLKDGLVVRFPPHCFEPFANLLTIGAPLSVFGIPVTIEQGTVIDAQAMGKDPSTLVEVDRHHDHDKKKSGKQRPQADHDRH